MKAIPYLVSGLAWFLIVNAFVQIKAAVSGGAIALSLVMAFISGGWLVYRSDLNSKGVGR